MAVPHFDLWPSFSDTSIIPLTGFLLCPVLFLVIIYIFLPLLLESGISLVRVIYNFKFDELVMVEIFFYINVANMTVSINLNLALVGCLYCQPSCQNKMLTLRILFFCTFYT